MSFIQWIIFEHLTFYSLSEIALKFVFYFSLESPLWLVAVSEVTQPVVDWISHNSSLSCRGIIHPHLWHNLTVGEENFLPLTLGLCHVTCFDQRDAKAWNVLIIDGPALLCITMRRAPLGSHLLFQPFHSFPERMYMEQNWAQPLVRSHIQSDSKLGAKSLA